MDRKVFRCYLRPVKKRKNLKFVWEGRGGRNRATDREGRGGRGKSNPRGERIQKEASKIVKTYIVNMG
jgi:hypothetical protein